MTPGILLILYIILFSALGIAPYDRAVWWAENIPTLSIVAILTCTYRIFTFSRAAYLWMSVFIVLHTIGGHYTFERVPFDFISSFIGAERNHFDRLAHFSVGFYAFAFGEITERTGAIRNRFVLFVFMLSAILAIAAVYEIIEWLYAVMAAPEQGIAFLGSQGDIWDAQKDMLADGLGAVVVSVAYCVMRRKPALDY